MDKSSKLRFFAENPRFRFLSEQDKYIFAGVVPKYKFNVIGTGTMGQEHMYVTTLEGRAKIHGIYDPHPPSVETAIGEYAKYSDNKLKIFNSLEQVCHDPQADALIICTPNYTHIDLVKEAIQSGKHILLEKPMATNIKDAYEIAQMTDQYSATFQIGLQYRYKSIYVEAVHEALHRKSLGKIRTISMLEHRPPFLDKVGQWNKFSQYSGGTLVEKCCHYFDLINLFAQLKPVTVYATGGMAINFKGFEYEGRKADIVENALVNIAYGNNLYASFALNMGSPYFYEELLLCGDEGRLKAYEEFNYFHSMKSNAQIEIHHGENQATRLISPNYATIIEQSGHHGATFYEHKAFVDQIEGKTTDCADVEQGFWSVVIGVAAEEALKKNQSVQINKLLADNDIPLD